MVHKMIAFLKNVCFSGTLESSLFHGKSSAPPTYQNDLSLRERNLIFMGGPEELVKKKFASDILSKKKVCF